MEFWTRAFLLYKVRSGVRILWHYSGFGRDGVHRTLDTQQSATTARGAGNACNLVHRLSGWNL